MPNKILINLLSGAILFTLSAFAGSLTPTISPGTFAYTLSDINNRISSSTFSVSSHAYNPELIPAGTFLTLAELWNNIPSHKTINPDSSILEKGIYPTATLSDIDTDLQPANIATGTSLFGVVGTYVPPACQPTEGQIVSGLRAGMIGYWPGNDNTDDNSGNSNNASWTIGSAAYSAGKFANAFAFNGAREVSLNMNNMPTQEIFSVSVWAKASQLNMRNGQMIGWGHDWSADTFALMIGGGDSYGDVSSNQLMVLNGYWKGTGYHLTDLNWHHFAATANGTTLNVYVDGVKVPNSLTVDGTMSAYTHLGHFPGGYYRSGESGAPFLRYYYGDVDEGAIWNRTLTETEIANLYNAGSGRSLVQ
ncbi:MAG: LamG domain-containing protein [bacterium]